MTPMAVYVYAITDGVGDVSDLRGLHDEPLRAVAVGSFVVVIGHAVERVSATRELLAAQDRIVRTLHARAHALLPVRFAATVPDMDALTRHAALKDARLAAALRNVRGRDQMTLWLMKKGAHPPIDPGVALPGPKLAGTKGPGSHYLAQRAAAQAPCPEAQSLAEALRPFVHDERIERGKVSGIAASLHHLIERTNGPAYRRAVVKAAAALPSVAIRVSGPSPAYAFTVLAGS
jgi:hypothetical protein